MHCSAARPMPSLANGRARRTKDASARTHRAAVLATEHRSARSASVAALPTRPATTIGRAATSLRPLATLTVLLPTPFTGSAPLIVKRSAKAPNRVMRSSALEKTGSRAEVSTAETAHSALPSQIAMRPGAPTCPTALAVAIAHVS
eukprot:3749494-Prymnesium_polylepis.2